MTQCPVWPETGPRDTNTHLYFHPLCKLLEFAEPSESGILSKHFPCSLSSRVSGHVSEHIGQTLGKRTESRGGVLMWGLMAAGS